MKQKGLRKLVSMILAVVMVLAMSITGFADEPTYSITISNTTKNETYKAYKVFDATYVENSTTVAYTISTTDSWYNLVSGDENVTNEEGDIIESPFLLTATTTANVYNVSLKDGKEKADVVAWFNAIAESQINWEADAGETGNGNGGSLELSVDNAGYYYITTSLGATVTVTTAKPTAEVVDKNQTPGGDIDKSVDDTEAQIGDKVTYTITSNVPAYDGETEITEYIFTDTLDDGLIAPNASEIVVKILDSTGYVFAYVEYAENSDAIIVSEQTITITYNPKTIEKASEAKEDDTLSSATSYPADATIEITYTATVDADAVYANGNTVKQTWTGESNGTTDTETVYTYGFNLKKITASGEELGGAKFKLSTVEFNEATVEDEETFTSGKYYTCDEDGVYTKAASYITGTTYYTADEGSTVKFVKSEDADENVTYTVSTAEEAIETIEVGSAKIFGLDADVTYMLTETVAPDGYNLLTETIIVNVGQDGYYNTTTGINSADTEVVNNAGTELPSTGGMGTTIFYIVGGVLVLGAAVLFVTKKRLGNEN